MLGIPFGDQVGGVMMGVGALRVPNASGVGALLITAVPSKATGIIRRGAAMLIAERTADELAEYFYSLWFFRITVLISGHGALFTMSSM